MVHHANLRLATYDWFAHLLDCSRPNCALRHHRRGFLTQALGEGYWFSHQMKTSLFTQTTVDVFLVNVFEQK
jgi:hypothetical protein